MMTRQTNNSEQNNNPVTFHVLISKWGWCLYGVGFFMETTKYSTCTNPTQNCNWSLWKLRSPELSLLFIDLVPSFWGRSQSRDDGTPVPGTAQRLVAIRCDTYRLFPCFVRLLDDIPEDGIRSGRVEAFFFFRVLTSVTMRRRMVHMMAISTYFSYTEWTRLILMLPMIASDGATFEDTYKYYLCLILLVGTVVWVSNQWMNQKYIGNKTIKLLEVNWRFFIS